METDNREVIDETKQRLFQIGIEDSSHLEHTFGQVDQTIHLIDIDLQKDLIKTSEKRLLEDLLKRNRVEELAKLLPIKRETSPKRTELFYDGEAISYRVLPYFKDNSENNQFSLVQPSETHCIEKALNRFSVEQELVPRTENQPLYGAMLPVELPTLKKNFELGIVEFGTLSNSECPPNSFDCSSLKQETTLSGEHKFYFGSTTLNPTSSGVQNNFLSEPNALNEFKIDSQSFQCLSEVVTGTLFFEEPKLAPTEESKNTFRLSVRFSF